MAKARKLPSGKWRTQVYDYTDENGKRHYESFTATTKKESEYLAAEFALKKKRKIKNDLTLKEARDGYIDSKCNVLSPSTIAGYRHMDDYFIEIDNIPLSKLTQNIIQAWVNNLSRNHSPKSVRNAHGLLSAVIKSYDRSVTLTTVLPQKIMPTYTLPSDDDISKIISYLKEHNHDLYIAVCLAAFGTLRRSEICALDASDVYKNTIHVHKAKVKSADCEWIIKTPKTTSSDRYVELPDFVVKEFPSSGSIVNMSPDDITQHFRRTLKHLNINHFRFHDLRHYSASIMHAIGIPDQYIMSRGGWSSDTILKAVYRGTLSDYQKKYTDATNDYFNKMQHKMQHKN